MNDFCLLKIKTIYFHRPFLSLNRALVFSFAKFIYLIMPLSWYFCGFMVGLHHSRI